MKIVFLILVIVSSPFLSSAAPPATQATARSHYQLIRFTNTTLGQRESGIMRLDTLTGRAWLFESAYLDGTNYTCYWVPIPDSPYSNVELNSTNPLPPINLPMPAISPSNPAPPTSSAPQATLSH